MKTDKLFLLFVVSSPSILNLSAKLGVDIMTWEPQSFCVLCFFCFPPLSFFCVCVVCFFCFGIMLAPPS